jgi:hypothetical protein
MPNRLWRATRCLWGCLGTSTDLDPKGDTDKKTAEDPDEIIDM